MKKIILLCAVLLLAIVIYAINDVTVPNTFTAGTKAIASEVNENFDSLETGVNRIVDTIDNRFVRFTDFRDSTIDTINLTALRGNPDVDSLAGAIVCDTLLELDYITGAPVTDSITINLLLSGSEAAAIFSSVNADTLHSTVYFDTLVDGDSLHVDNGKIDTINSDTAKITNMDIQRADIDTVNATYGNFTLYDSDSININKIIIDNDTDSYRIITNGDKLLIRNDSPATIITIDSSGKVGIGTDNPINQLDVLKNQNAPIAGYITNTTDGTDAYASWSAESVNDNLIRMIACPPTYSTSRWRDKGVIKSSGNVGILIEQGGDFPIDFWTNNENRVTITGAGFVGIDTTAPGSKLHVAGSGRFRDSLFAKTLNIESSGDDGISLLVPNDNTSSIKLGTTADPDGASITFNYGTSLLQIGTTISNGQVSIFGGVVNEGIRILNSGFVGIDTTAPGSKLHVAGSIRARDTIFANNISIATIFANNISAATIKATDTLKAEDFFKIPIQVADVDLSTNIWSPVGSHCRIDTESSAALDTCERINIGGSDGTIFVIRSTSNTRDVLMVDGTYLKLAGDFLLDEIEDVIVVIMYSTIGYEISRSDNQ
jgi:hypothetical protein